MVRYTITCCKCKTIRRYEGTTVGDCLEQAKTDGWVPTGKFTERVCKECREINESVEFG